MAEQSYEVVVSLGGEDLPAGRLYSHRGRAGRESSSFGYYEDFIARPDAYQLDPSLPLETGTQAAPANTRIFRAFADAAPDRWGRTLIDRLEKRLAEETKVTSRSLGDIDYLLGVRDDARQGELRFRELSGEWFLAPPESGVPELAELPRLLDAAQRFENADETPDDLQTLIDVGSSLGGARPKAHVVDANGRIAIAKFPSQRYDTWNVMAWEKVALDLAAAAGIRVPESTLLWISERSVLVVDRFDRGVAGERIGYASGMTMTQHNDGDLNGSYLELIDVIERYSPNVDDDLHELWRRIVFSILISNTDDHLRNHGFLHHAEGWTLSPVFDLNPNPEAGIKHLKLAIDQRDTEASLATLLPLAGFYRLTDSGARDQLDCVAQAVANWRDIAAAHRLDEKEIAELASAFRTPDAAGA